MKRGYLTENTDESRRDLLTREAKARLRPLCSHFPEDEFDTMVNKIVDVQLRGETRTSIWGSKAD